MTDSLDAILAAALKAKSAGNPDWQVYETFKLRIDALLGHGDDREEAIKQILEALEL